MLVPCLRILSICNDESIEEKTVTPVIIPEMIPRSPSDKCRAKKMEAPKLLIRSRNRKIEVLKILFTN